MSGKLQGLKPNLVFEHFEKLSEIPHGSKNEKGISDYLVAFFRQRGLEPIQDASYNVAVDIPATPGYENQKKLILQSHMDMVCRKDEDIAFDFKKDPLNIYIEDDYLKAHGTTLGADDGIGVALMMAVADTPELAHPPLRLLFTTGEEIAFVGASAMEPSMVDGDRLIGLDCSKDDIIIVSCAGMSVNHFYLPCRRVSLQQEEQYAAFKIDITGLLGGHSGNMIHLGRACAIKLFGQMLSECRKQIPIQLLSFECDGLENAISNHCSVTVACLQEHKERLFKWLTQHGSSIQKAYSRTDPGIIVDIKGHPVSSADTYLDDKTFVSLLDLLILLPHGASSHMDDAFTLASSSSNIGGMWEEDGQIHLLTSIRSNTEYFHDVLMEQYEAAAKSAGAVLKTTVRTTAWEYDPHSTLMEKVSRKYEQLNGQAPIIQKIHACVEGGIFQGKAAQKERSLDIVNIGCKIFDVHTPRERLYIPSVEKVFQLLTAVLEEKD